MIVYEIKAAGLIGTYAALGLSSLIHASRTGKVKFIPPSTVEINNPSVDFEKQIISKLREELEVRSNKLNDIPTMSVIKREGKRKTLGDIARECVNTKLTLDDLRIPVIRMRSPKDRKSEFCVYLPLSPEYGKYRKVYNVGLEEGFQAYVPAIIESLAFFGLILYSIHIRVGDEIFFIAIIPTTIFDGPELGKIQGSIHGFIGERISDLLIDPKTPSYIIPLLTASTLRGLHALSLDEEDAIRHLRNCSLIVYSMDANRQEPRTYANYPFNRFIDFIMNLKVEDHNLYELIRTCTTYKLWDVLISLTLAIENKSPREFFEAIYSYRSHINTFDEEKRKKYLSFIKDTTIKNAIKYFI